MKKFAIVIAAIELVATSLLAAAQPDVVRVEMREKFAPGTQQVVVNVYPTREGGAPLASETRLANVTAAGVSFAPMTDLGASSDSAERWLAVRIGGVESPRVRIKAAASHPIVQVVSTAAISANGLIESTLDGFRFPDGTIQTSAATVSGGVPSVNGIGGAVTIIGLGTASVGTAGSTVTVTGSGLSGITAGNGLTGGGTSGSPTLAASFGTPVAISTTNSAGVSNDVARADHVHDHGNLAGGTLHATATSSTAGFMSAADKSKVDATVAYARTIVVSPSTTPTASGNALLTALNSITTNSSSNPYLIKLEPGVYSIGVHTLQMLSYVDIEGSGQNTTVIQANQGNAQGSLNAPAVAGASNSELRNLTVTNTTSAAVGTAYLAGSSGVMSIRNVTMTSSAGATASVGINAGSGCTLNLAYVTVTAAAAGVSGVAAALASFGSTVNATNSSFLGSGGTSENYGAQCKTACTMTLDSSIVSATGTSTYGNIGLFVSSGNATLKNSTAQAETSSSRWAAVTDMTASSVLIISNSRLTSATVGGTFLAAERGAGSALGIAMSELDGPTAGTPVCVFVYDGNFASTTCP